MTYFISLKDKITETMSVIFLLIIFSLAIACLFLGIFIWAVRSGQYDDDYTPSVRMLFDNDDEEA